MAKPVDLRIAGMSDHEARDVQEQIEHKLGARCGGCGRRIRMGMKFTSIDPRASKPVLNLFACSRDECDFMERCKDGATFVEMIEFVWLDESGIDAPPSLLVERRNKQQANGAVQADR